MDFVDAVDADDEVELLDDEEEDLGVDIGGLVHPNVGAVGNMITLDSV
jgi:hypothetical protein